MHTEIDIRNYINNQLDYLNLNPKEIERYVKFIKKLNTYIEKNKHKMSDNCFSYLEKKLDELYCRFIQEGYSQEESIELTKKAVLNSDRKEYKTNLDFVRAIGFEQKAIREDVIFFKRRVESAHYKKAYLVEKGNKKEQTLANILRTTDKDFEDKFSINMTKLTKKYPITDELKQIWLYQANLTDEEIIKEFGLNRYELSYIYPKTKEELATIKKIATMTDEEINERYGISRQELLQKQPLNTDTLNALRSINLASDKAIKNTFNKTKKEILK